jgi:hypothetical protein
MTSTMSDDQFTKLFKYMTKEFASIKENMATKDQVDRLMTTVDGIVARLDVDDSERAAPTNQVDRHEGWIKQLAEKTDVKLSYEQ